VIAINRKNIKRILCSVLGIGLTLVGKTSAQVVSNGGPATPGLHWQPLNEPGCGGAMVALAVSPHDSRRLLVAGDMLGDGLSTDGGDSWQTTTGFKAWEMADFTWHPTNLNTVWTGSMSGPYLSTDGGRTWQQKRNGFPAPAGFGYGTPIEKVLIDPQDTNHLLAVGGSARHWESGGKPLWGAVWESHDVGNTWTKLTTITAEGSSNAADAPGTNITWADYAPGGNGLIYATADKANFLVSTDNGKTWTRRNNGLPPAGMGRVAVHPTNKNIIWIAVDNYLPDSAKERVPGGVYKTTDGGLHWTNSSNGLGKTVMGNDPNLTSRYFALAVAPTDPQVLYANDAAWNTGVIYRSTDGGANWRMIASKANIGSDSKDPNKQRVFQVETAMPAGLSLTRLVVDPKNANTVYGFNSEFIVRTRDGGQTWDDATAIPAGGDAWRGRGYSGWVTSTFRFHPTDPNRAFLVALDAGKMWVSRDNLRTWTRPINDPWPWGGGHDVTFAGSRVYATFGQFSSFYGIGVSPDKGDTWKVMYGAAHGLPETGGGHGNTEPRGIFARPDAPEQVWASINGTVYHSTDGGDHWATTAIAPNVRHFVGDPRNPRRFYAAADRNVYQTDDGGSTFTAVGGPHNGGRMAVDAQGRFYLAASEGERSGLWRYDGKAWTRLLDEHWITDVTTDPTNPNRLAITTNQNPYTESPQATGVWISADGGKSWVQQNDGLAMLRGFSITFNPHNPQQLVWGSDGRGYWMTNWPRNFVPTGTRTYTSTPDDARFAAVAENPAPVATTAVKIDPNFKLVVRNGSMTQGLGTPAEWRGKFGDVDVARDTEVFKTGPASLRVTVAGGKNGQAFQTVQGGAGATFKIAGWIKAAGNVKAQAMIQAFAEGYTNNKFIQLQFIQNDTDWMHFEKEVTLPEWTSFFNIGLLVEGDGKAWLDEVHEANSPVDAGKAENPLTAEPAPKGKPWEAGWGFYPQFPEAWQNVHKGFLERTRQGVQKHDINVVFLGDSITQGWGDPNGGKEIWDKRYAPLGAVNYGVGGDSTRQVLWRIQNGELDGLDPKLVVLKIGTNNLYGDNNAGSDEEIAQGITEVVKELRQKLPNTKVLLLGILPRQNEYFSGRVQHINAIIRKLDDGKNVRFLDMGSKFQTTQGKGDVHKELYTGDVLHLVKPGYQVWADTMQPLFDEMMK